MRTNLIGIAVLLSVLYLAACGGRSEPPADEIAQAVRATLTALPTQTPFVIEVTRSVTPPSAVSATATSQAAAIASPVPAATTAQPPTPTPSPSATPTAAPPGSDLVISDLSNEEAELYKLINQSRLALGLPSLRINQLLSAAARRQSRDMAFNQVTSHRGSDGSFYTSRISDAGYTSMAANEVIGWGSPSAADALDWWIDDPGHRPILLSEQYAEIGVGYLSNPGSQWVHYWTAVFGVPEPGSPVISVGMSPEEMRKLAAERTRGQPAAATATPTAVAGSAACPTSSDLSFAVVPMERAVLDHPDYLHGDLNLALRGVQVVDKAPQLISLDGPTDADAPQLRGITGSVDIQATVQVGDWDWSCGEHGCRTAAIGDPEVSLLGLNPQPGQAIHAPARNAAIYGDGIVATVLFATSDRITLAFSRDGTVANGYAVHLENLCVDPNLVALYQLLNATGRSALPGLYSNQVLGIANNNTLFVAIRDRGRFMDPRSRKDWWR